MRNPAKASAPARSLHEPIAFNMTALMSGDLGIMEQSQPDVAAWLRKISLLKGLEQG